MVLYSVRNNFTGETILCSDTELEKYHYDIRVYTISQYKGGRSSTTSNPMLVHGKQDILTMLKKQALMEARDLGLI